MVFAKITLAFLLMTTFVVVGVSHGAVHKVGDSAGWTVVGNVDYNNWASSKDFHVGDTIVSQRKATPIVAYTTGSHSIALKRIGHYYFLCGVPGHCDAGQKLDIMVTPASLRPSTSPIPSSASPRASSPIGSSSQTSPNNPDNQSNASSLQALSFKLWPALLSLAILITGFAF